MAHLVEDWTPGHLAKISAFDPERRIDFSEFRHCDSYDWDRPGEISHHGNSIMAAIGLTSLRYLDQDNAYRRQIAVWYDERLQDEPEIQRVPVRLGCLSSRHLYQTLVENRDEVMLALK